MKFTSYNGITFSSLNVTASLPNDTQDRERNPVVANRINDVGLLAAMAGGARAIPVYCMVKPGYDTEATLLTLLAAIDQDDPTPRYLVGQLNDGTQVRLLARPGAYVLRPEDTKGILITFYSDARRWEATAQTTESQAFGADGAKTITVYGQGRVLLLLKVGWTNQRNPAFATADVGWTKCKLITVQNLNDQALYNQIVQLGPINTATLVTNGKMRSDCNDFVVFDDRGVRLRRVIAGTNSRGTFLTFVVAELAAGATKTFYACYGNQNATQDNEANGFPYSYPGSPVPDVTGIDGLATGGSTTSMTTGGVSLDPNRFLGGTLILTKSATAVGGQYRRIGSHTTGGVFTPSRAFTTAPTSSTRYVVLAGPFMGDGGQASAVTANSLTDAAQSWNSNEWIGARVEAITLDTDMGAVTSWATVTGNTATQLTTGAWSSGTPSGTTLYRVWKRNANYLYQVEQVQRGQTNHRGLWRLNKGGSKPSQMWFASDGAPGSWTPTTYNPGNALNDYNQLRVTGADIGGGDIDYFAVLNAKMARKDGYDLPDEGFANGVEISIPLGILGIRHDYKIRNPDAMCRAVFGCRDAGGEDWELYKEDSALQSTLVLRSTNYYDLTQYGTPHHLLAALTSDDDAAIDKKQREIAMLTNGAVLEVRVDSRNLVVTDFETANELDIYDLTLVVRRFDPVNLVTNGSFDSTSTGWALTSSNGADTATWDAAEGNLAKGAYRVVKNAGARTFGWITPSAAITTGITAGASYLFSASFKGTAAAQAMLTSVWFDASNNFLGQSSSTPLAATTSFQRLTHTATAPALAAKVEYRLQFDLDTIGATLHFDDIALQRAAPDEAAGDDVVRIGRNDAHLFLATGEKLWVGPIDDVPLAARIYNGSTWVRDVPWPVEILHVEPDYKGVATRMPSASVLPLKPGLQTYRVNDPAGAIGNLSVELLYRATYL